MEITRTQIHITMPQQLCQNGNAKMLDNNHHDVIYSSPEIVSKIAMRNEKYAVQRILEKYDSLKCLNGQFDDLKLSESCDSTTKGSLDSGSTRQDSSTTSDDYEELPLLAEPESGQLSDQEISQIEVFFRSHKTSVFVCHCLANLYMTTITEGGGGPGEWTISRTGVPVMLLDKGETRARDKRMLQIVIAERGSGFVLWKDIIDNLSDYRAQDSTFHTMYLSTDHRKMAGLSYDILEAAERFMDQVLLLTSDPLNISLSIPKQKKKSKLPKKKVKPKSPPKKCDISQPCCFEHVTSVALDDKKKLFSMATLMPSGGAV